MKTVWISAFDKMNQQQTFVFFFFSLLKQVTPTQTKFHFQYQMEIWNSHASNHRIGTTDMGWLEIINFLFVKTIKYLHLRVVFSVANLHLSFVPKTKIIYKQLWFKTYWESITEWDWLILLYKAHASSSLLLSSSLFFFNLATSSSANLSLLNRSEKNIQY